MTGEAGKGEGSPAKPEQAGGKPIGEGLGGSTGQPADLAARRVESGRAVVPQPETGQESNWFTMPYDLLVGQIDHFVERARARHPQTATDPTNAEDLISYQEPFNAAEWLALQLQRQSTHAGEQQQHFANLWRAWEALSYDRFTSTEMGIPAKNLAREDLELYVGLTNKTSLTLSPEEVTVLDAMAEVVGIPRKRGEATINLSRFVTPTDTPPAQSRENKSIIRRRLRK